MHIYFTITSYEGFYGDVSKQTHQMLHDYYIGYTLETIVKCHGAKKALSYCVMCAIQ